MKTKIQNYNIMVHLWSTSVLVNGVMQQARNGGFDQLFSLTICLNYTFSSNEAGSSHKSDACSACLYLTGNAKQCYIQSSQVALLILTESYIQRALLEDLASSPCQCGALNSALARSCNLGYVGMETVLSVPYDCKVQVQGKFAAWKNSSNMLSYQYSNICFSPKILSPFDILSYLFLHLEIIERAWR